MSNESKASQEPLEQRPHFLGVGLLPTEDRAAFKKFREIMLDDLDPEGVQQGIIADRIIILSWRLQNLGIFFAAQQARKSFAPFLRKTLDATLLAYSDFSMESLKLYVDGPETRQTTSPPDTEESRTPNPNDAFKHLMETAKGLFSAKELKKLDKQMANEAKNGMILELAFYAELFTPENYLVELEITNAIEHAIEKNRESLRKLKEEKRKSWETPTRRSRIFPPY